MKKIRLNFFFFLIPFLFIFLSMFSGTSPTLAYNSGISWAKQTTGCKAVQNLVNQTYDDLYLGYGQTVPASIKAAYPLASSSVYEAWKSNMIGLKINQFKSFYLTPSQTYPNNLTLFYDVLIVYISTGGTITTSTSVIGFTYSVYTGCVLPSSSATATASHSSAPFIPQLNNNSLTFLLGGITILGLIGVGGFYGYLHHKPKQSTDEILEKTKQKETLKIQSLKETLDAKENSGSTTSKSPSSIRRRR